MATDDGSDNGDGDDASDGFDAFDALVAQFSQQQANDNVPYDPYGDVYGGLSPDFITDILGEFGDGNASAEAPRLLPPPLPDTRQQITNEASAYQMVSMLDGAVQRGTARSLRSLGFPIAGKTGTSDNNTNGWFVGFTPDLVVGVYVGYDEPRSLGEKELGSTAALPIFKQFMTEALGGRPKVPFRRPPGINLYTIDSATGVRAKSGAPGTLLEAFKSGQEPPLPGQDNQLLGEETGSSVPIPGLY